MRSIWKGTIGFGLVTIPVKLYSASQSSTLNLDMLDKRDKSRIRFQRVNENTHKEVAWENIVKAYNYKDDYVLLDDEDFKEAAPEKSKEITIDQFIMEDEIDTRYFDTPYYLEPEKGGAKAYGLLRDALKKSGRIGIATFVLRTSETLAAIKPLGKALVLNKLRFAEEIRSTDELDLPAAKAVSAQELKLAMTLIDQHTKKFNIESYKNEYAAELLKVIKAKATGKKTKIRKIIPPAPKSKDLMGQLKASLAAGKKRAS